MTARQWANVLAGCHVLFSCGYLRLNQKCRPYWEAVLRGRPCCVVKYSAGFVGFSGPEESTSPVSSVSHILAGVGGIRVPSVNPHSQKLISLADAQLGMKE